MWKTLKRSNFGTKRNLISLVDFVHWGRHGEFWIQKHCKQNRTNTASPQEILSTHPHRDFVSRFTWCKWFLKKKTTQNHYFYISNIRNMVNPKDLAFFIINMLTCMGVRLYSTFCMRLNTVTTKSRLIDKSLLFPQKFSASPKIISWTCWC